MICSSIGNRCWGCKWTWNKNFWIGEWGHHDLEVKKNKIWQCPEPLCRREWCQRGLWSPCVSICKQPPEAWSGPIPHSGSVLEGNRRKFLPPKNLFIARPENIFLGFWENLDIWPQISFPYSGCKCMVFPRPSSSSRLLLFVSEIAIAPKL